MPIFSTDSGSINHLSITGSLITSGSTVAFNNLTTQSQNWVLTYNSQSGQLFYTASTALGGGGSTPTSPGGSNTQIQFNSGSTFSGSADLTFNYANRGLQLGTTATASGQHSFALGDLVQAIGNGSQAEGQSSITRGNFSHASGLHSVTSGAYQFVVGQHNISSSTSAAFIIGNGATTTSRSNLLFAADSQVQITGSLNVSGSITGSLQGTASWAQSASNAVNSQTASFLPVGTYAITSSWAVSASQAVSASRAISASVASTASFLPVGTYNITSSWAQSASNAVNAQTASFLPVGTYNVTASWAISASQASTASFLPTGTYNITSSWAVSASQASTASFLPAGTYNITASWAQSASNAVNARTASFLPTGTYNITASWAVSASQAVTASYANFALSASYASSSTSASYASASTSASYALVAASVQGGSTSPQSLSQGVGITAFTFNGGIAQTVAVSGAANLTANKISRWTGTAFANSSLDDNGTLVTGSVSIQLTGTDSRLTGSFTGSHIGPLTGTASWAQSSSNAVSSQTASFLPVGTYAITSSWAVSASQASTASFLPVGTYNITSSWAVSSSRAVTASFALSAPGTTPQGSPGQIQYNSASVFQGVPTLTYDGTTLVGTGSFTGSFVGPLTGTSSWAQSSSNAVNSQTASFLPVGTYAITSSWAVSSSRALTASFLPAGTYAITSSWAQSSSNAVNAQTASFLPAGTYAITSSWAQSSSNAVNSQTASFLPVSTYNITASWAVSASQAVTAAFALNALGTTPGGSPNQIQYNSASLFRGVPVLTYDGTTLIGTGSFTGSFTGPLTGTASWAQSASNAVNARTASFLPVGTYAITSSWAQSASNAVSSQTASFLPVATYNITSSWAVSASQAVSASRALTASFLPAGTYAITSSWATNALTASNLTAGTYNVTASLSTGVQGGIANYIPLWNTATTLTSSIIYQDGSGNIGIGNAGPIDKLYVESGSISLRANSGNTSWTSMIKTYPSSTGGVGAGVTMWSANTSLITDAYGWPGFVGRNLYYSGSQFYAATTNGGNNWGVVTGMMVTNTDTRFLGRAASENGLNFGLGTNIDSITRMVINTAGDVGIGVTSPSFRLDVSGSNSARFQNGLTVNGALQASNITGSLFGTASWAQSSSLSIATIAGGSNTQIQFNSGSRLQGNSAFTFNYLSQSLEQGINVIASGSYSHAEGQNTIAIGFASHAEGFGNDAFGNSSHAEGNTTNAYGDSSHAEGAINNAYSTVSHVEGRLSDAGSIGYFVSGSGIVNGQLFLSESYGNVTSSFTLGGFVLVNHFLNSTTRYTITSSAAGLTFSAGKTGILLSGSGINVSTPSLRVGNPDNLYPSKADASMDLAQHAEGTFTKALGGISHAEGYQTTAIGMGSHTEGQNTLTLGAYSHAEGNGATASGVYSHAEGDGTQAIGQASNAKGLNTIAQANYQLVAGQNNIISSQTSTFIIGNGATTSSRSNLLVAGGSQVEISGSLSVTGSAFIRGLANTAQTNVLTYNSSTGQVFFTASSAIGGGGSGIPTSIATGSVTASVSLSQFSIVSGSSTEFTVTGTGVTIGSAITDAHRITGSVSITGSFALTGSSASILSGSASGSFVTNLGDTFTGTAPVTKIVTLSSAEYTAATKDSNTLYIII